MAASVEVRVPLLDDELVALTARIPSSLKLHGTVANTSSRRARSACSRATSCGGERRGSGRPFAPGSAASHTAMEDLLSEDTVNRRGLVILPR